MEHNYIQELREVLANNIIPKIISLMLELELNDYIISEKDIKQIKIITDGKVFLENIRDDGSKYWYDWTVITNSKNTKLTRKDLMNIVKPFLRAIENMENTKQEVKDVI